MKVFATVRFGGTAPVDHMTDEAIKQDMTKRILSDLPAELGCEIVECLSVEVIR